MNKVLEVFSKKEGLLILFLVGLILLVIAIPTKKTEDESMMEDTEKIEVNYCENLEMRLEEILSCVKGVGRVEVMITIKDNGIIEEEKDMTGTKIQGVLIVAQGASDPLIKQEIMKSVMALFEVESHKINIINME